MVLINKNIAAALGYAVFGRAVFGLNFESQYIPAELYDDAVNLGLLARPDGIVSRRYPFRIDQPGTPDQRYVWDRFTRCNVCWHQQPWEGGVTPPARGPRNRPWWYANSPIHDPIYRNWFMQETLNWYIADQIPPWCVLFVTDDSWVNWISASRNYGGLSGMTCHFEASAESIYNIGRMWIKTPGYFAKRLYLHIYTNYIEGPGRKLAIHFQNPNSFSEDTLTWNNQPALGPKIKTFSFTDAPPVWLVIEIGPIEALCIKFDDETPGEDYEIHLVEAYTHDYGVEPQRPFSLP